MRPPFPREYASLFWKHVVKQPTGCWEWGGMSYDGYGFYAIWGKGQWRAHRVAYELTHGNVPRNLMVCHRCDNGLCVRPTHLFLGTNYDNMRDAKLKQRPLGRYANGLPSTCSHGHLLTQENVYLYRRKDGRIPRRNCRKCSVMFQRKYRLRKRQSLAAMEDG